METKPLIPPPVCAVVGEVLGNHYFSHSKLNTLFMEHGAPGDPPDGNCTEKCRRWLLRAGEEPNALNILGGILMPFMETDVPGMRSVEPGRERIQKVLATHGLKYQKGAIITQAGISLTTQTLDQILRSRDLAALEVEHRRALDSVTLDPPTALTASCAILEALFKVYMEDEGLPMPKDQSIKPLWEVVRKHIGFDPSSVADTDLQKILTEMASIVDGIGAFRTHASSAHGRGRKPYNVQSRHAHLAVNASYTLATFVLQTWDTRREG